MVKVSPYYRGTEAVYFVDRLPYRERSTWNHHEFFNSEECL